MQADGPEVQEKVLDTIPWILKILHDPIRTLYLGTHGGMCAIKIFTTISNSEGPQTFNSAAAEVSNH